MFLKSDWENFFFKDGYSSPGTGCTLAMATRLHPGIHPVVVDEKEVNNTQKRRSGGNIDLISDELK
jgi:hypothetical protein